MTGLNVDIADTLSLLLPVLQANKIIILTVLLLLCDLCLHATSCQAFFYQKVDRGSLACRIIFVHVVPTNRADRL